MGRRHRRRSEGKPDYGSVAVDVDDPVNSGLLARYLFNEGAGGRATDILDRNYGTLNGFDKDAWVQPLTNNGSSYVNIADAPSLNPVLPFWLSIWLRFTSASNLVIFEKNANSGFSLQCNGGGVTCWSGGPSNGANAGATIINNGRLHNVIVSLTLNAGQFVIDGLPVGGIAGSGAQPPSYGSSTPLLIGSRSGSFGFVGQTDDACLFSGVPTQDQINQIVQGGPGGWGLIDLRRRSSSVSVVSNIGRLLNLRRRAAAA